jgi:hypothetical protein
MKPDMNAFKSAITSASTSSNTLPSQLQQVNDVKQPSQPVSNSGSIIKYHSLSVSFKDKCKYISKHYESEPYIPTNPWYDSKKIKQMLEDAEKVLLNSKSNHQGTGLQTCLSRNHGFNKRQNNTSFENSQLKKRKF